MDTVVFNEETGIAKVKKSQSNKKQSLTAFLLSENSVSTVAEKYAKKHGIKLSGAVEIGCVTLKKVALQEQTKVLDSPEFHDQVDWVSKNEKQRRHNKTEKERQNPLPLNAPIPCWKFYGKGNGGDVLLVIPLIEKMHKAIIPVEDILNHTNAKKHIDLNGLKYEIKLDATNKKFLVAS